MEMSLREDRMHALLRQLATLRKEGDVLPINIQDKEEMIQEKWDMLKVSLIWLKRSNYKHLNQSIIPTA